MGKQKDTCFKSKSLHLFIYLFFLSLRNEKYKLCKQFFKTFFMLKYTMLNILIADAKEVQLPFFLYEIVFKKHTYLFFLFESIYILRSYGFLQNKPLFVLDFENISGHICNHSFPPSVQS